MKRIGMILGVVGLLLGVAGCHQQVKVKVPQKNEPAFVTASKSTLFAHQQKILETFVRRQLVHGGGVYTNYKNTSHVKNMASGHEMLSESSGLWLEYLAQTHQFTAFRHFYQLTKRQFNANGQFSYRIDRLNGKKYGVNATLDDLRIIRALQIYGQFTHSHHFRYEAAKRFAVLRQHTMAGGRVSDFYDVHTQTHSMTSSLAYYDLLTLRYFEHTTSATQTMYQKQLRVVQHGYLGDGFPLYASSYNWNHKQYSQANINTSEGLETLYHLSEVHQLKQTTFNWLKQQIRQQKLYNGYTVTGVATDRNQSAANYALAAMVFANQEDRHDYRIAMQQVWQMQVTSPHSSLYGGIGDARTREAYSFNNLSALLASLYD